MFSNSRDDFWNSVSLIHSFYTTSFTNTHTIPTASLGNTGLHFPCIVTVLNSKL